MSDVWRIFVVEGDENLNRNIVTSLHKDGYEVQGVLSGADAVRALWSEEYDLVICDLKTPSAEGIELLQWLRAYRPNTRMILVGGAAGEPSDLRMQALESGASSYLEKPLDLHLLKEEIRRLLQQTGFSANLDSFDLLDVIQIITMSRKSIALLVNTGLEERGILRFKNGELIWAEYGVLRGEEAFFALAAHKMGTVIHQPWNDQITSNVTQPLSRLIFQALQYRTKYANTQQFTGEQEAIVSSSSPSSSFTDEIDDSPFAFLEDLEMTAQNNARQEWGMQQRQEANNEDSKEWWEKTGSIPEIKRPAASIPAITHKFTESEMNASGALHGLEGDLSLANGSHSPVNLPSWLTDQPTPSNTIVFPPQNSAPFPGIQVTPLSPTQTSSPEWPLPDILQPAKPPINPDSEISQISPANGHTLRRSSPTWELSANAPVAQESTQTFVPPVPPTRNSANGGQPSQPMQAVNVQRSIRRNYNYASLVAALQTLGYAIPGFESAAIVSMEGQPIAQVSIDDQDLSQLCKQLSQLLKSTLQAYSSGENDLFEDLIVQSQLKRTLLRIVGQERNVFLMLITSRDADLNITREIVLNIDNAISAALHG
jgi:DNA-binding response OmpR family regulator/predicted regulator of Ras-like GTPase activity (Roadblock/LC7/MglB family)